MSIEKLLQKTKLTEREVEILLRSKAPAKSRKYHIGKEHITYCAVGDTHVGHKCYDSSINDYCARMCEKRKVDIVLHGGDICEGWYAGKGRPGHVFELDDVGGDAQVEHAARELRKYSSPILAITGNHENNTFAAICGFDIGKRLENEVPNFKYLGQDEATVDLAYKHKLMLIHPDGGTAYALSYRPQKIIESLEGGTKPNILHVAHFHKSEYMWYRNIHCLQTGTMCRQTPFMKRKAIAAHCGFWIVEATLDEKGVTSFKPEWYAAP